ncbi:MAG: hypothetical protein ACM33T_18060 [Solirubrobacterales bacterium]
MRLNAKEKEALTYLGTHLLYGVVAGLTFGLAALAIDLGRLRTLAFESGHTGLVLAVFFFGLFVTFGSVGMGVGVMSLASDDKEEID